MKSKKLSIVDNQKGVESSSSLGVKGKNIIKMLNKQELKTCTLRREAYMTVMKLKTSEEVADLISKKYLKLKDDAMIKALMKDYERKGEMTHSEKIKRVNAANLAYYLNYTYDYTPILERVKKSKAVKVTKPKVVKEKVLVESRKKELEDEFLPEILEYIKDDVIDLDSTMYMDILNDYSINDKEDGEVVQIEIKEEPRLDEELEIERDINNILNEDDDNKKA